MYLKLVLHHLASMGMFVQCRILSGMFWHLQSIVGISLHFQSLDRDSLHLQHLVGISEILMPSYSAMHPRCLSYVASKNWCCCSFIIKVHIDATSMRVQVLIWSVDMASWQRWMLAQLQCKWSVVVALWQRWMLARLLCKWSFDVASWQRWMLARRRYEWSVVVASWQRWMLARL